MDVLFAATSNRYADGDNIRLVNLKPIALFSNYKTTTSSGKHLEKISHAHIASFIYNLITSSRGSDDLSIGCHRDRGRRLRELISNENQKGKYHVRIYLKDVSGFAKHQIKATCGLGSKLTLTRNSDDAVLNKDNATNIGKIKNNSTDWFVPHYTPSFSQENILMKEIVNKTPTELHYVERKVFMKEVNTQKL